MQKEEHSQDTLSEIERLEEELRRLKEDIDHSYYRVPKQEFENITVKKIISEVTDQVNKRINAIRNWVGIGLLILSFFGITQWQKLTGGIQEGIKHDVMKMEIELRSSLFSTLSSKTEEIVARVEKTLDLITTDQRRLKDSLDEEIGRIEKSIDEKTLVAAKKETDLQVRILRNEIEFAEKVLLRSELNALRSEVKAKRTSRKDALIQLQDLLQKVLTLDDKKLASEFLDELFRWTFDTNAWEKLDELRLTYQDNFEFKASTWANIAIADMFLYEESFAPVYRERAISAYEKALNREPTYGIPHAVRLILHMIDYEREKDPNVKESEKKEAQKLINLVCSGSRSVTPLETYDYLKRNASNYLIGGHINMLFETFPVEMKQMGMKADDWSALNALLQAGRKDEVVKKLMDMQEE